MDTKLNGFTVLLFNECTNFTCTVITAQHKRSLSILNDFILVNINHHHDHKTQSG